MPEPTSGITEPLRLHIGGIERRAGWQILNIQPGPLVDHVGDCTDLSRFAEGSVDEVYASHVYEHLGYQQELPRALAEIHRILKPGGILRIAVPDLEILCRLFIHPDLTLPERFHVMRMMFGGQIDPFDFHKVGLNWEILSDYLGRARFRTARRVASFELFQDCSVLRFAGHPISLNVEATK
jgi:predicted SAM-dependent methyltransferase